jgi:hypothetical protein
MFSSQGSIGWVGLWNPGVLADFHAKENLENNDALASPTNQT